MAQRTGGVAGPAGGAQIPRVCRPDEIVYRSLSDLGKISLAAFSRIQCMLDFGDGGAQILQRRHRFIVLIRSRYGECSGRHRQRDGRNSPVKSRSQQLARRCHYRILISASERKRRHHRARVLIRELWNT